MKCTECDRDAVALIPIYTNNNQIMRYEGRCSYHIIIERKKQMKKRRDGQIRIRQRDRIND